MNTHLCEITVAQVEEHISYEMIAEESQSKQLSIILYSLDLSSDSPIQWLTINSPRL